MACRRERAQHFPPSFHNRRALFGRSISLLLLPTSSFDDMRCSSERVDHHRRTPRKRLTSPAFFLVTFATPSASARHPEDLAWRNFRTPSMDISLGFHFDGSRARSDAHPPCSSRPRRRDPVTHQASATMSPKS